MVYLIADGVEDRQMTALEATRIAQVESCERANVLREEVNEHVDILGEFLSEAALARSRGMTDADIRAAEEYELLAERLDLIDIIDCEVAFPPVRERS